MALSKSDVALARVAVNPSLVEPLWMYTVYHLLGGSGFVCFFGTMHAGWVKNKTHETSTFKRMINGVYLRGKSSEQLLCTVNARQWHYWGRTDYFPSVA